MNVMSTGLPTAVSHT